MTESKSQFHNFCFTLNNPTLHEIDLIKSLPYSYLQFGNEIAPTTGTPHLQGLICFVSKFSHSRVRKNFFNRANISVMNGTITESDIYTSKDSKWERFGTPPINPGVREKNRWTIARQQAEQGERITDDHIGFVHHRLAKEIRADYLASQSVRRTKIIDLRPWQQECIDCIKEVPDGRTIRWYYDLKGGAGKSELSKYLCINHSAFALQAGPARDLAHILPPNPTIVIFDFVRTNENFIPYGFIEAVTNGEVMSLKYNSTMKYFDPPHVLVFANFLPTPGALSEDRIKLYTL